MATPGVHEFTFRCLACRRRNTAGVAVEPGDRRRKVRIQTVCQCLAWHELLVELPAAGAKVAVLTCGLLAT